MKNFTRATLTLKEHNMHLMAMEDSSSFTGGCQLCVQQQLQATAPGKFIQIVNFERHSESHNLLWKTSLRRHRESMSSSAGNSNFPLYCVLLMKLPH